MLSPVETLGGVLLLPPVSVEYDLSPHYTGRHFLFCPFCRETLTLAEAEPVRRPTCPSCGFVQFINPAPAVAVLVVREGQVLLGRRAGHPGQGRWALPSGYIEYYEDFLACAGREVKEETGLEVRLQAILHVESAFLAPQFHFLTVYLLAEAEAGDPQPGDDSTAVQWFPSAGPLPDLAFPQDEALIKAYAQAKLSGLAICYPAAETRA